MNSALLALTDAIIDRQARYSLALLADYYFFGCTRLCGYFSVNLVLIVLILIVNTIFSFSHRPSLIGKPRFDFHSPRSASE